MLSQASAALLSKPVLIATAIVLALDAAVLLLGGFTDGYWRPLVWMLFSCAAAVAVPSLNASPSAPLLGRIILVLTAVAAALSAVDQVRSWLGACGVTPC
jgi:hypothetical protein